MPRRTEHRAPNSVYEQFAPAVLGYFRSHRMRDPEGLTGDVFVAVTEKLGGFRGDDAALRRWVFTIAHHRRIDAIRRAARSLEDLGGRPEAESYEDPAAIDPELVEALGVLTDEQREVIVLRFVADLPIDEVARLTGRSKGAVKMLQSRGTEVLRRALDRDPTEEIRPIT